MRRTLERPGATGLVIALGVLLCAPSLGNGLNLDDVLQAVRLGGAGDPWRLFDLFGGTAPMVPDHDLPWWRHEQMRLSLMARRHRTRTRVVTRGPRARRRRRRIRW
jgi:hypothetical protein